MLPLDSRTSLGYNDGTFKERQMKSTLSNQNSTSKENNLENKSKKDCLNSTEVEDYFEWYFNHDQAS